MRIDICLITRRLTVFGKRYDGILTSLIGTPLHFARQKCFQQKVGTREE